MTKEFLGHQPLVVSDDDAEDDDDYIDRILKNLEVRAEIRDRKNTIVSEEEVNLEKHFELD